MASNIFNFEKNGMKLRIRVTENEPFFMISDFISSIGVARSIVMDYMPKGTNPDRWIGYTELIDIFDRMEKGGTGIGRKRINPIYRTRVDRFRNWIEWEVIPQLTKFIYG